MQPTKIRSLLIIAAISALAGWIAIRLAFSSTAPLPWSAIPALALLAIGEVLFGRNISQRLHGKAGAKPIQPMVVPRVVALAKASSAAAAVFAGLAIGVAIFTLPSLSRPAYRHDALAATFTAVAAIALAAAALYLERCCRAQEPPEDDELPSSNGQHGRHG
jgi:Protein of unknown function (DUF3180)